MAVEVTPFLHMANGNGNASLPQITLGQALKTIKDYWVIIIAVIFVILAVGETRWQVEQLGSNKEGRRIQWQRIGDNSKAITDLEAWRENAKQYISTIDLLHRKIIRLEVIIENIE